jgi:hypothetical protein
LGKYQSLIAKAAVEWTSSRSWTTESRILTCTSDPGKPLWLQPVLVDRVKNLRVSDYESPTRRKLKFCLSKVAATKDLQAVYTFLLDPGRIPRELQQEQRHQQPDPYSSREQAFKFLISLSNIAAVDRSHIPGLTVAEYS